MSCKQQRNRLEAFCFWQHVKAHIMKVSSQDKTTEILGVAVTQCVGEKLLKTHTLVKECFQNK